MSHYDEFDNPRFVQGMEKVVHTMGARESLRARGPLLGGMVVVALVSVLVGVVFFSYPKGSDDATAEIAVPIIRADAGAIKALPQDPGGMDIPYRDSTVFETLAERQGGAGVENLLDDVEEPMARSQIFAGLKTDLSVDANNELNLTIAVPKKVAAADVNKTQETVTIAQGAAASPAAASVIPAAKPQKVAQFEADRIIAALEPAAGDAASPAAPAVTAVSASGSHMVQLGSVRSEDGAQSEWSALKARFPGQLSALDLRVQKADLGSRGVYYRIQGGPVEEAQARAICSSMEEKRPGGCLVVKR